MIAPLQTPRPTPMGNSNFVAPTTDNTSRHLQQRSILSGEHREGIRGPRTPQALSPSSARASRTIRRHLAYYTGRTLHLRNHKQNAWKCNVLLYMSFCDLEPSSLPFRPPTDSKHTLQPRTDLDSKSGRATDMALDTACASR